MYTGNVSSLRQLACEYAEQSIDRDTYLKNRGRLLDQLSGELPTDEEGENTVRLPIGTSAVSFVGVDNSADTAGLEMEVASLSSILAESPDILQPVRPPLQPSTVEPQSNPAKKLGKHRTLILVFWIILGLGGAAIYMIASGQIF
jgi:hypothetical protein